jgi:hypothetical protein
MRTLRIGSQHRIRARLESGFVRVASLTLLASVVAFFSYNYIRRSRVCEHRWTNRAADASKRPACVRCQEIPPLAGEVSHGALWHSLPVDVIVGLRQLPGVHGRGTRKSWL